MVDTPRTLTVLQALYADNTQGDIAAQDLRDGVQSWHPEAAGVFDVRTFGAVGDGSTDDSAAIQAAIDALGSARGIVFFPWTANHYQCDNDLDAKRAHLLGVGWPGNAGGGGSVLKFSGTFGISSSIEDNHGFSISHMLIKGSNGGTPAVTGQILVDFTGQNMPHLEYVILAESDRGLLLAGSVSIGCNYGTFEHVNVYQCWVGTEFNGTFSANSHAFYGGRYWTCETGVLISSNNNNINFFGTAFECGDGNIGIDSTGKNVGFFGCRFETQNGTNLLVRSGANTHWEFGSHFSSGVDILDENTPSVVRGNGEVVGPGGSTAFVRAGVSGPNIIKNGLFEYDTDSDGTPDDWADTFSTFGSGYTVSQDGVENQQGTYAVKIANVDATNVRLYQVLAVTPNVPYVASFRAKGQSGAGLDVELRIGDNSGSGDSSFGTMDIVEDDAWDSYAMIFTPTTEVINFTFYNQGGGNGNWWFDVVALTPGYLITDYVPAALSELGGNVFGDLGVVGDVGFYGTAPIAQQTGVAVTAAEIHAALVSLGLITA